MWDQVRVDCGREFSLMLYVQESLSFYRNNTQRAPYLQTTSTRVNSSLGAGGGGGGGGGGLFVSFESSPSLPLLLYHAERHWVEVNSRVNFPLKRALTNMQHHDLIDMDCPVTKYCVSVMTGKLAQVGIQTHISSWNHHRIPGMSYSLNVPKNVTC